jgi:hypothetical protein
MPRREWKTRLDTARWLFDLAQAQADKARCSRTFGLDRRCLLDAGHADACNFYEADLPPEEPLVWGGEYAFYFSDRGIPLAYTGKSHEHPVLTCELYPKWYSLYLVDPDGKVRRAPLDLDELEQYAEGATTVGDHCWNPYVVQRLADAKDWIIDDVSFDFIIGRWATLMGGI